MSVTGGKEELGVHVLARKILSGFLNFECSEACRWHMS